MTARPTTIQLRHAVRADVDALAALEIVAWRAAYRGQLSSTFLDRMDFKHLASRQVFEK